MHSGGSAFDFASPDDFDDKPHRRHSERSSHHQHQQGRPSYQHQYHSARRSDHQQDRSNHQAYNGSSLPRPQDRSYYDNVPDLSRYDESPQLSPYPRPHSREITPDFNEQERHGDGPVYQSTQKKSKKFLKKVQHELDEQRAEWADEVEKLTGPSLIRTAPSSAKPQGTNSYVDTSTGAPIFKAYVDVREFPAGSVNVNVDTIRNKVIVTAEHRNGVGTVTRTFTQKVQLPRYADEQKVRSFLSKSGVMKIEVPLMYYFPMHTLDKKGGKPAKSFVNEIKTLPTGQQCLEILVNTGSNYQARDLHVRVLDDDKLVITAERMGTRGTMQNKLIKQYTLPKLADPDTITSRLGRDGRLAVTVPLKRNSRETTPTPPR